MDYLELIGAVTDTQLEVGKEKHIYPHIFKSHENQADTLHW